MAWKKICNVSNVAEFYLPYLTLFEHEPAGTDGYSLFL